MKKCPVIKVPNVGSNGKEIQLADQIPENQFSGRLLLRTERKHWAEKQSEVASKLAMIINTENEHSQAENEDMTPNTNQRDNLGRHDSCEIAFW